MKIPGLEVAPDATGSWRENESIRYSVLDIKFVMVRESGPPRSARVGGRK
jgi:hypothetical protein